MIRQYKPFPNANHSFMIHVRFPMNYDNKANKTNHKYQRHMVNEFAVFMLLTEFGRDDAVVIKILLIYSNSLSIVNMKLGMKFTSINI